MLKASCRFFSIALNLQQLPCYSLSRTQANILFKEIEKQGKGNVIRDLDNLYRPEKLNKTFQLLGINSAYTRIDTWKGYFIKVDSKTKEHIESYIKNQLTPIEPESPDALTNNNYNG